MKSFLFAFLLCGMLLPRIARSAEEQKYPLIPFMANEKEAMSTGASEWAACGDYFAEKDSGEVRTIYYAIAMNLSDFPVKLQVYTPANNIVISIDRETPRPEAIATERSQYILKMNADDYRAALPCIASGEKT